MIARPGDPDGFAFSFVLTYDDAGEISGMLWYGGGGVLQVGTTSSLFTVSVTTILAGLTIPYESFSDWWDEVEKEIPWWLMLACDIACGTGPFGIAVCIHCLGAFASVCIHVGPSSD